jgi:signal peptidase II
MNASANRRITLVALAVLLVDQFTKQWVISHLLPGDEKVIIRGFFRLVHWTNTGAAWSLFMDNNKLLAVIALAALVILYRSRHHFETHTVLGQVAMGLIFGGIVGNLTDRFHLKHVTDFAYFYLQQRGGHEIGFPAFNVADSCICVGVFLIFLLTWKDDKVPANAATPPTA